MNEGIVRQVEKMEQFSSKLLTEKEIINTGFSKFSTLMKMLIDGGVISGSIENQIFEIDRIVKDLMYSTDNTLNVVSEGIKKIANDTETISTEAITELSGLLSIDPSKYQS